MIHIDPDTSALVFRAGVSGIEVQIDMRNIDLPGKAPDHVQLCVMIAAYVARHQREIGTWFKEDFQRHVDASGTVTD